jgi:hypothetical protein
MKFITNPQYDVGYISYNEYANGGARYANATLANNTNVLQVSFAAPHNFVAGDTIGFQAVSSADGVWQRAVMPFGPFNVPSSIFLQFTTVLSAANINQTGPNTLTLTYPAGAPARILTAVTITGAAAVVKLEAGAKQTIVNHLQQAGVHGVPMYYLEKPTYIDVTVRHILTHTAGYAYSFFIGGAQSNTGPIRTASAIQDGLAFTLGVALLPNQVAPVTTLKQWAGQRARLPLAHQPGEAWMYGPVAARLRGRSDRCAPRAPSQLFDDFPPGDLRTARHELDVVQNLRLQCRDPAANDAHSVHGIRSLPVPRRFSVVVDRWRQ